MFDIVFPAPNKQKYWDIHYKYVLSIFEELKCNIVFQYNDYFVVSINKQKFLFDYSDSPEPASTSIKSFKFHCINPTKDVIPFPPVSFDNWKQYNALEFDITYRGNSNKITCRQRPYGNAKIRRMCVQEFLVRQKVQTQIISQEAYWREINDIFLPVFVPGWSNNMLDRGMLQYMAFGCPIVTTEIPECLPFNQRLIAGTHYIQCQNDYSDLTSRIEFYKEMVKLEYLQQIGKNAKDLFSRTCTPEMIGKWIAQNL